MSGRYNQYDPNGEWCAIICIECSERVEYLARCGVPQGWEKLDTFDDNEGAWEGACPGCNLMLSADTIEMHTLLEK